jgi:CubicO group peptidase (beta-lactamase class C family)
LQPYLARYNLPTLAAALVRGGEIVASGAIGTRRAGADIAVTLTDCFHIGSDTKAMTAVIATALVEGGKISFNCS